MVDKSNTIELSLGDFTTMKIDRLSSGSIVASPMDSTIYIDLINKGWREIRSWKQGHRVHVLLERPDEA